MAAATALTIASLAATAAKTGASFVQASKQKKLQQKAEREADKALADARKKLDVNFYEGLSIQKEPYELAREALLSSGAQAIQAGVEGSERGAAATAGRVQMAQQQGQREIAGAMGQQMMNLEKLVATEDSRLTGEKFNLDMLQQKGAQLAARDAEQRKQLATKQAMEGVGSLISQGASLAPLFGSGGGGAFDPSQASFQETQMTFNPTLDSMQTTIDNGMISPGVNIPTANRLSAVGYSMPQMQMGGEILLNPIR